MPLTRFYLDNAHVKGLSFREESMGADGFNGFRQKQEARESLPQIQLPGG
jgi:hypothetical protein